MPLPLPDASRSRMWSATDRGTRGVERSGAGAGAGQEALEGASIGDRTGCGRTEVDERTGDVDARAHVERQYRARSSVSPLFPGDTVVHGPEPGLRGGRAKGKKSLVAVAVEVKEPRGLGRCRMAIIPDASAASLHPFVTAHIEPGASVMISPITRVRAIRAADRGPGATVPDPTSQVVTGGLSESETRCRIAMCGLRERPNRAESTGRAGQLAHCLRGRA